MHVTHFASIIMMDFLIEIIIPGHNQGRYLAESVDSAARGPLNRARR